MVFLVLFIYRLSGIIGLFSVCYSSQEGVRNQHLCGVLEGCFCVGKLGIQRYSDIADSVHSFTDLRTSGTVILPLAYLKASQEGSEPLFTILFHPLRQVTSSWRGIWWRLAEGMRGDRTVPRAAMVTFPMPCLQPYLTG
jgi:hypothetical protein